MGRPKFTIDQNVELRLLEHNVAAGYDTILCDEIDLGLDHGGADGVAFLVLMDSVAAGGEVNCYIRQRHPGGSWESMISETNVDNTPGQGGLLLTEIVRPRRRCVSLVITRAENPSRCLFALALIHGFRRPQRRQGAASFPAAPNGIAAANAPGTDG
jgi:hypothetical protein